MYSAACEQCTVHVVNGLHLGAVSGLRDCGCVPHGGVDQRNIVVCRLRQDTDGTLPAQEPGLVLDFEHLLVGFETTQDENMRDLRLLQCFCNGRRVRIAAAAGHQKPPTGTATFLNCLCIERRPTAGFQHAVETSTHTLYVTAPVEAQHHDKLRDCPSFACTQGATIQDNCLASGGLPPKSLSRPRQQKLQVFNLVCSLASDLASAREPRIRRLNGFKKLAVGREWRLDAGTLGQSGDLVNPTSPHGSIVPLTLQERLRELHLCTRRLVGRAHNCLASHR
mmetsp:Transcript_9213/g.32596  ORF Transcript_9213/g.32596 Transcript_9213/m.32596 type:complete len:280 (+) Transcript_9213:987-1826(+)